MDQDGFPDIAVASINVSGTQSAYVSWLKGNGDDFAIANELKY